MSIIDTRSEFGVSFDITETTGTYLFTNQIDLGIAGRDVGNGKPVALVIQFMTSTDSAADGETVQFRLASDDSASIHATTSTEHLLTEAFTQDQMVAGSRYVFYLPVEGLEYERYLGLQAIVGGETITAGTVSAWLAYDPIGWKAYPDGNN